MSLDPSSDLYFKGIRMTNGGRLERNNVDPTASSIFLKVQCSVIELLVSRPKVVLRIRNVKFRDKALNRLSSLDLFSFRESGANEKSPCFSNQLLSFWVTKNLANEVREKSVVISTEVEIELI